MGQSPKTQGDVKWGDPRYKKMLGDTFNITAAMRGTATPPGPNPGTKIGLCGHRFVPRVRILGGATPLYFTTVSQKLHITLIDHLFFSHSLLDQEYHLRWVRAFPGDQGVHAVPSCLCLPSLRRLPSHHALQRFPTAGQDRTEQDR